MNRKSAGVAVLSLSVLWGGSAIADRTPWTHLNYQNNPDDFQFAIVPDRTGGESRENLRGVKYGEMDHIT